MNHRIMGAAILAGILVLVASPAAGQGNSASRGRFEELDAYVKMFGAVLTGLGTLFGLPLALVSFRKTRAEIRKLELEADALVGKTRPLGAEALKDGAYSITVRDSPETRIMILADPRFLGPLLLLLDFILAWVILTVASFATKLFPGLFILTEWGESLLLIVLALILLVPIWREARRVREVLRPASLKTTDE